MVYGLLFLVGLALGASLLHWRNLFTARSMRKIPKEWPLKNRPLVNNRERRVWLWLIKVMFDQQVLVKLPVTRFTTPANQQEASHWYKLLNGVYCTFTVCNIDGNVIGCIDVPGPKGLSMSNQTLKHTLLTQCGLRYWVIDPSNLPQLSQIRMAFLGEVTPKAESSSHLEGRLKDVSENLHAAVTRQRHSKNSHYAKLDSELSNTPEFSDSRMVSGWEQNSFLTPLDSRTAPLGP